MKNKLRRSMTSVLLAASLLFSSQSVIAFADDGSKSDASDLSPVQESVEPVIRESQPMMARANAPVAYSAPTPKPGYVELSEYDTWMDDCEVHIYSIPNAGYIKETYNFGGSTFPQTSGCRVYEATPADGWVFNTWEYSLIHDGKELGNRTDYGFGKRYTFSSSDSSWHEPYQNGDTSISVNRLTTCGEVLGNPLYYSVYANFSPLVTVTTVGNGSVTPNLTLHKDNQYKAEYDKDATFTITPNPGYEVDTVKVNGSPVEFTEVSGGNYTLPSVTEPTTLEVTFEEDSTIPSIPEPDNSNIEDFIVTVKCDKDHSSPFNPLHVSGAYKVADKNPNLRISWISVNHEVLCDEFSKVYGNHTLLDNDSKWTPIELKWDDQGKEWKLSDSNQKNITLNVKCTSEIPEPDESIISQLEVALNCVNVTDGSHNDTSKLSTFTTGYYTCTVDQEKRIATVKIDDTQAKYWIDNNINTMVGKEQHSFVSVSDPITLTYKNGQWKVPEDDNAKKIVIKMLCGPSIAQLNDQLNVKMVCDNNGVHSGNNEQFSREYDILADSYHLDMYSVGKEYRCDVTIDATQYLSKFDQDTNATHVLMSSDNKRTLYYTEDGNWLIVPDEEKTVTFNVSCKPDINFPNPPDKETVLGLIGDVTIQCTTASSGHGPNKYSLTKDNIDLENVVPVQMTAGNEIQFILPVTIKNAAALQSGFLANYNTLTGKTHTLSSGSIPTSITLTYDSVTKAWANKDVNGIVLSVYCTTGGGTIDPNPNPGGNGGDNDDDDDRYTGDNTVTRTINDDDVPLNDRPNNTTTIDDEDVPLADLPDDTVTIDDGEVPLKDNPSTGDSLPFAAMAAAVLSLGGVIVLNRKKK